jgi:methyl-accepting chemotaxis protein
VQGVDSVLQLIENISEQTNLLALNAAIEAARAGEHGRGFAVVADEVRTLATRTQESTRNIKQMSSDLSSGMERAVEEIRSGSSMMESVLNETRGYRDSLDQIIEASRRVADMNTQIASATEQQSMTIEEINRNIGNINLNSEETAEGAERARAAATELQRTAAELETLVRQVKS